MVNPGSRCVGPELSLASNETVLTADSRRNSQPNWRVKRRRRHHALPSRAAYCPRVRTKIYIVRVPGWFGYLHNFFFTVFICT